MSSPQGPFKVAFDIDGTLLSCNMAIAKMTHSTFSPKLGHLLRFGSTYHDMFDFVDPEDHKHPTQVALLKAANAYAHALWQSPQVYREADVFEGALAALEMLVNRQMLAGLVTHRPDITRNATREWFTDNLENVGADELPIIHVPSEDCKSQACRDLGAQVLVEDAVHVANRAAASGLRVLLLTNERNVHDTLHPGVTRVADWSDLLLTIGVLYAEHQSARSDLIDFQEAVA